MKDTKTSIWHHTPPWLNGRWGRVAIVSVLYTLAYLAWLYFHWGGEENVILIGDIIYLPLFIITAVVLLRTATRPELNQRQRRAWWFLGLANVSYLLGDLIWAYFENVLNEPPFPSIADVFYLAVIPLILLGSLNLAGKSQFRRRYDRQRYWLDLGITALAATILVWHFVVADTLAENASNLITLIFAISYPVGDLILIVGLLAVLLRRPERDTRSVQGWVLLALFCFIFSDLSFAYTSLQGTYFSGSWVDAGWTMAFLFFELAALRQLYQTPTTEDSPWSHYLDQIGRWAMSGMVLFALGLVIYLGLVNGFGRMEVSWLTVGALLVVALVSWRFFGTRGFADLSLGNKLISSFLIVSLIPLVGFAYYNTLAARQNLTESANRILRGASIETAEYLDNFIAENLATVRMSAQLHILRDYLELPASERLGSKTEMTLLSDLSAIADRDQIHITSVSLMDKRGTIVADTIPSEIGEMNADKIYFTEPVSTGLPYASPVVFDDGKPSLLLTAPVHGTDGNILGILRIRYDAVILQELVTDAIHNLGFEGTSAILFDEHHIRLADSTSPELLFQSVVPLPADTLMQLQVENRLPEGIAEELATNFPGLEQSLNNAASQPIFVSERQIEEVKIQVRGRNTQVEQASVTFMKSQPWLVMATQPQFVYVEPVSAQTRTAGLAVMVVAMLVALVALAMSQAISNPIVHLRDFANQVASGNLQVQAQVHSRDETGQLANAFNDMTSQLRKSFEDLDRRAKEVTTVADVSRRLSSILDQHQLVSEVVEQLQSAFNYYHAHIYLFDETGENLVMAGGTGEVGKALLERRHKIPRGRGLVGRAAETKEAVLVPDTSNDPNWLPNPLLPETRSEVAVPILAGDHVLGVLDVQNNAVDSLRQQDSDLILSIANQIAVAIQNIRLYEETRNAEMAVTRRANELELASRVATATATILDSDKLLQEVVDLTKQTFRLYHAHIYLLNEAGDTLELTSGAGEVGRQMVAEGRQIPLNREQSLVARAARERRGFYVNDVRSDPHFLPHPLLPETRSELAVPMIIGDKVIGVFDVQSDAVDYFTDEAVRIQTTLAAQVSIALQNARSLISAKRRAEREAALNVIGQKIQGATSVEAVLQIAARELGRALGAPLTVAQLGIKSPGRNGDDHR